MAEYYFKMPQLRDLTDPQQAALNEVKQIALSGGPGTGKSVVSLRRHILQHNLGKTCLLLTYTTTLAKYLKACCKIENQNAANNVGRSYKDKNRINANWIEIIIDEAQDLPCEYYDEIKKFRVSYGADDSQILYPDKSITQKNLKELFPENEDYVLDKNFRSTQRIMQFAKVAFPDAYIPKSTIDGLSNNVGELPIMLISDSRDVFEITNDKQDNAIIEIINSFQSGTHNIAILVPWKSHAKVFEKVIKDKVDDYSIYYEDNTRFPDGCEEIKNVHITTFKSTKGLEFDTVIIPNYHKRKEIDLLPKHLHLKWNDYYVAVTRARSNLYLITNYNMPEYNLVTDKQIL
jgi:DNA helicase IV